ncbi:unnamed protein product [Cochlearia groenlandica]
MWSQVFGLWCVWSQRRVQPGPYMVSWLGLCLIHKRVVTTLSPPWLISLYKLTLVSTLPLKLSLMKWLSLDNRLTNLVKTLDGKTTWDKTTYLRKKSMHKPSSTIRPFALESCFGRE